MFVLWFQLESFVAHLRKEIQVCIILKIKWKHWSWEIGVTHQPLLTLFIWIQWGLYLFYYLHFALWEKFLLTVTKTCEMVSIVHSTTCSLDPGSTKLVKTVSFNWLLRSVILWFFIWVCGVIFLPFRKCSCNFHVQMLLQKWLESTHNKPCLGGDWWATDPLLPETFKFKFSSCNIQNLFSILSERHLDIFLAQMANIKWMAPNYFFHSWKHHFCQGIPIWGENGWQGIKWNSPQNGVRN